MGFESPLEVDLRSRATVELAAGGLVWRRRGRRWELAVVHRPRHEDWTLPKGRLEPGESLLSAAVREVREETGCEVEVRSFAGTVVHTAKGLPKIVHHWHMELVGAPAGPPPSRPRTPRPRQESVPERTGDGPAGPQGWLPRVLLLSAFVASRALADAGKDRSPEARSREVDRVLWLTPEQARSRLTHREERELLSAARSGWRPETRWRRGRIPWTKRRAHRRLERELAVLEAQLRRRGATAHGSNPRVYLDEMTEFARRTREAVEAGQTEAGWRYLSAARQIEIHLCSAPEIENEARLLLEEAREKLRGWRKAAIETILDRRAVLPVHVAQARAIRDDHFGNLYYKIDLGWSQIKVLLAIAAAALIVLVDLLTDVGIACERALRLPPLNASPLLSTDPVQSASVVVAVLTAGVLGAAVSAVLDIARSSEGRIPERLSNWMVTVARLGIGSAGALVVWLALISGALGGLKVESTGAVLLYSIVAGSSERLLKRALAAGGADEAPTVRSR